MENMYFLGIDVSKKKLDAALTIDGKNFHEEQFDNTSVVISSFLRTLKKKISSLDHLVVCLEHTGVYSIPLLRFLVDQDIKVCLEPALQIKQSQGMIRGKNDQVDARRIAVYAFKNSSSLRLWKPQRQCVQKLKAMLSLRDRLTKSKMQLEVPNKENLEFIDSAIAKDTIKLCRQSLRSINKDIERIESAIADLIKEDVQLSTQYKLVTSVPGVGMITALHVIVATDEFTRIQQPKKFACYAGIAPFEHTSGSSIRGRSRVSRMANMTIKRLLHMAAMSAIQSNDELKLYYHRKVNEGKNKMSVINAVRNKLITRIFSCIKNNRKYQNNYQYAIA